MNKQIKILIGVDFGTTKTTASYRVIDEDKSEIHKDLLKIGKEGEQDSYYENFIPSTVFIKNPERFELEFGKLEDEISYAEQSKLLVSIKRCLLCELENKPAPIPEHECLNRKNYKNKLWCKRGNRIFDIKQYNFRPRFLYREFMEEVLRRIKIALDKSPYLIETPWKISELKVTFPVIFYKAGPSFGGYIENQIGGTINKVFDRDKLIDYGLGVIEEPTAALLENYVDIKNMSPGYGIVIDIGGGTTDLLLYGKYSNKIRIWGKTSFPIGGDDYDVVVKKLIISKLEKENIDIDEDYLLLNKLAKEIKENKELGKWDGKFQFEFKGKRIGPLPIDENKLNNKFDQKSEYIVTQKIMNKFLQRELGDPKWSERINTVLLTGGGNNIKSLRNKFKNLFVNAQIKTVTTDLDFIDDKLIATGLGASIATEKYINFVEHSLPLNILIQIDRELVIDPGKSHYIYRANQKVKGEVVNKIDLKFNSAKVYLLSEKPRIPGTTLLHSKSISTKQKKKSQKLIVKYKIDYNSKMKVELEFGGKTKILYHGYPQKETGFIL